MRIVFRVFRRFVWLGLGILVGWVSSLALTRRLRRATRRFRPAGMSERVRVDVRAAVREGREAMREREAELRGGPPAAN